MRSQQGERIADGHTGERKVELVETSFPKDDGRREVTFQLALAAESLAGRPMNHVIGPDVAVAVRYKGKS